MPHRGRPRRALIAVACATAILACLPLPASSESAAKVAKACASARNHVVQQQKAMADFDVRIERERRSRSICGTQKACRRYDRRIESLEKRKGEHEARLLRLQASEAKACSPP